MTTRLLQFSDNDLAFLLLNILGHDPIHDFGDPTPLRWGGIVSTLRAFDAAFVEPVYLIGGGRKRIGKKSHFGGTENSGSTLTMPFAPAFNFFTKDTPENGFSVGTPSVSTASMSRGFRTGLNTANSRYNRITSYNNATRNKRADLLNQRRSADVNDIEVSIFGIPIDSKKNAFLNSQINDFTRSVGYELILLTLAQVYTYNIKFSYKMDVTDLYVLIRNTSTVVEVEGEYSTEYARFFEYLARLFLYFATTQDPEERLRRTKLTDDGNRYELIENPIDYMSYFFSNYEDEINTLFYLSTSNKSHFTGGKTKKYGGAPISVDRDFVQMNELVQRIEAVTKDTNFIATLDQMEELSRKDFPSDDEKRNNILQYGALSEQIRTNLSAVFSQYGAGDLFKKIFEIRELTVKPFSRRFSIKETVIASIQKSLETPKKVVVGEIAKRQRAQDIQAAEERALVSGILTQADKNVFVKGFIFMIASFAMTLCGYPIEASIPNTGLPILDHEINILKFQIAGKRLVPYNMTDDLDTQLLNFYKNSPDYQSNMVQQRTTCKFKNYLSNNASSLGNLLSKTLCNSAARIDGMSYCSRTNAIEYGSETGTMNFFITGISNQSFGYKGVLTPDIRDSSDVDFSINLEIDVLLPKGRIIGKKLNVPVNKPDTFKAVIALGNSVKTILLSILPPLQSNGVVTDVADIWKVIVENMYEEIQDPFIDPAIRQNTPIYNVILRELLFKGTGDLFQEINAVCKNGGYISPIIYSDNVDNSAKYKGGDAVRYFSANDRPSSIRFMHMLLNGNPKQINLKAFGGYISEFDEIIVKRPENNAICSPVMKGGKKRRTYKKLAKSVVFENK